MEQIELTLEQQFSLKSFEQQVSQMSHDQAQDFLIKLYEQYLVKDTVYRAMLRDKWGV